MAQWYRISREKVQKECFEVLEGREENGNQTKLRRQMFEWRVSEATRERRAASAACIAEEVEFCLHCNVSED